MQRSLPCDIGEPQCIASQAPLAAALTIGGSAASPRFYHDDPIWQERDTEDASSMKPLEWICSSTSPPTSSTGARRAAVRAQNVNTVDEVPDSSWFTNRAGARPLTPEDVRKRAGHDRRPGAGHVDRDLVEERRRDAGLHDQGRERAALVPEVRSARLPRHGDRHRSRGDEADVGARLPRAGEPHRLHAPRSAGRRQRREVHAARRRSSARCALDDIDTLLERADREPDGSYRVVASKALAGKPIGRIRFYDTRPDDPNDIVPHEHRRELRGYGVFAAWLNHVDAKAINSLDTLVTENGRSFVRHHLIDFGSALGSGGVGPADYWAGSRVSARAGQHREADDRRSASRIRSGTRRRSTKRRRSAGCPRTTRLQSGSVEAARAEPGVPARARRRQVLGGAEAGGDDAPTCCAPRSAPASSAIRRRKRSWSGRWPSGAMPSAGRI